MGKVLQLPVRPRGGSGLVRVLARFGPPGEDAFTIGHERAGGGSRKVLRTCADPAEAIRSAIELAEEIGDGCEVLIGPGVVAAIPETPASSVWGF
jgi:hypothetical protein